MPKFKIWNSNQFRKAVFEISTCIIFAFSVFKKTLSHSFWIVRFPFGTKLCRFFPIIFDPGCGFITKKNIFWSNFKLLPNIVFKINFSWFFFSYLFHNNWWLSQTFGVLANAMLLSRMLITIFSNAAVENLNFSSFFFTCFVQCFLN